MDIAQGPLPKPSPVSQIIRNDDGIPVFPMIDLDNTGCDGIRRILQEFLTTLWCKSQAQLHHLNERVLTFDHRP